MYQKYGKRILDFLGSMIGLIVLSPVLIVIGILVRTNLGKPILFCQKRPGKNEKIFQMYKFRTMTNRKDGKGHLLSDEERLTKFGRVLRATSLDELPELFNIIKGDMSFVGPRPLLVSYLDRYNEKQKERHNVRPGLTGLAQINGRNTLTWEERFSYDLNYIANISFMNDIKIIIRTIIKLFHTDEVNSPTAATMEEFQGNNEVIKK